ncbi:hypothetical protein GPECTOR_21g656 [Gonium pectorale]|uniref:Protein kinase domain-containing protein n=1 Tax=Gonium pectorale TaxID=33097 RepID=A0A150GJ23_GONPE|nr:hypothetical protein GPECTOR_21g656 [Gonium pectorale]|eukprot:KXZ49430.1 hypothetical protein GPECTOR_21g656 [Gonium pectorale]
MYEEQSEWPILDSALVRGRAPGMDLLAKSDAGSGYGAGPMPMLRIDNAIFVARVCLPPGQADYSFSIWQRPPELPGSQQAEVGLPQRPDCVNSTSARPARRCWAAIAGLNDVGLYGGDVDSYGKSTANGYLVWAYQTKVYCHSVLTDECISTYSAESQYEVESGCSYGSGYLEIHLASSEAIHPTSPEAAASHKPAAAAGKEAAYGLVGMYGASPADSSAPSAGNSAARSGTVRQALLSELALVAITPLTPLAPELDLAVRLGGEHAAPDDGPVSGSVAGGPCVSASVGSGVAPGGEDDGSVVLLPTVLGKGSCGRVVLGLYKGERVAVKLLNGGLAAPPVGRVAAPPAEAEAPPTEAAEAVEETAAGEEGAVGAVETAGGVKAAEGVVGPGAGPGLCHAPLLPVALLTLPTRSAELSGGGAADANVADAHADGKLPGGAVAAAGAAALTAPPPPWLASPAGMLAQEVEVLGRCRHPNVTRLLAASLAPPRLCLVMELMDTSLARVLYGSLDGDGVGQLLPLDKVLHIAMEIAQALTYLHPTVLHRDLKPHNVLISRPHSRTPVVKLADFGLSRIRDTVLPTRCPEVGTTPYMSPEAFDATNHTITDRADVYAFGVILWEMLAGRRPWVGHTPMQGAGGVI